MSRQFLAAVAIVVCAWTGVDAQEKPAQASQPAQPGFSGPRIPVRVQFVLSRYKGEKKVTSLPYVLGVLTGGQKTSLRMGIQVPLATGVPGSGAFPSYSYKDVGTNIDCQAQDAGAGQFSLNVVIEGSSIHLDTTSGSADKQIVRDVPAFQSFNASFAMLLRDGQTLQYASATDPISGEVLKIDVTLNVVK